MRKLLLVLAMAIGVVLSATPAIADRPTEISGDWTYIPEVHSERVVGPNVFIEGSDIGTWTGGFEGTSTEEFRVVVHPTYLSYRGLVEFEGYFEGLHGTLTLKTNGFMHDGETWVGHWLIVGSGGELEGLRGVGTFIGPSLDVDYQGKVHFGR